MHIKVKIKTENSVGRNLQNYEKTIAYYFYEAKGLCCKSIQIQTRIHVRLATFSFRYIYYE